MQAVLDAARANPVRVATWAAALVVFLAAKLGVVVDEQNVGEALALIVPILLGAEAARSRVVPLEKLTHDPTLIAPDAVNQP